MRARDAGARQAACASHRRTAQEESVDHTEGWWRHPLCNPSGDAPSCHSQRSRLGIATSITGAAAVRTTTRGESPQPRPSQRAEHPARHRPRHCILAIPRHQGRTESFQKGQPALRPLPGHARTHARTHNPAICICTEGTEDNPIVRKLRWCQWGPYGRYRELRTVLALANRGGRQTARGESIPQPPPPAALQDPSHGHGHDAEGALCT